MRKLMQIEYLNKHNYYELIAGAKALSHFSSGKTKVWLNSNQHIIKLLRQENLLKRILHWRLRKLAYLTARLQQLNIKVPKLTHLYYCPELRQEIIVYEPVAGIALNDYIKNSLGILRNFAEFIAYLHQKKVYFRGAHSGNILVQPDKDFALIDIANMKFGINIRKRAKNICYIINYHLSAKEFLDYGHEKFINDYLLKASLSKQELNRFWRYIHKFSCSKIK